MFENNSILFKFRSIFEFFAVDLYMRKMPILMIPFFAYKI